MNYLGNMPFGVNANMSVDAAKQGMYGQNAMVAPNSYGGDPYSVMGGGNMAVSGTGPLSIQAFRQSMLPFLPQQPANPYQGMTPYGNPYQRMVMSTGMRQNRLGRPYGGPRDVVRHGGLNGGFGPAVSGYGGWQQPAPYDSIG